MAGEADAAVLLCVAFLFPPAAVAFISGCGVDLCVNVLLCLLGYLPGCVHAFWLVLKRTEANERYGYGNWTYAGMGEYRPRTQKSATQLNSAQDQPVPPPPQPPQEQKEYPADKAPPSSQAPVDQKPQDAQPSTTSDQKQDYTAPPPLPPPAPESQKYDVPPSQAPASGDQTPAPPGAM